MVSARGAASAADALLERWFAALADRLGDLSIFDCHAHLGCADPDGSCFNSEEPLAAPGPLLERVHALLVAAAARLTAGYPADEYLELARLACALPPDHPDAGTAASVRALLDRHATYVAGDPPRRGPRVPGVHLIFVAAAIARTPGPPLPDALEDGR